VHEPSREAPDVSFAYISVRRWTITGVTGVHRGCSLEATACCTRSRWGEKETEREERRRRKRARARVRERESERERERDRDNRDISSARQHEEKEKHAEGQEGGKRAGGKEEPEEWIEDVRRPVHHLCRPTGIAAGMPV